MLGILKSLGIGMRSYRIAVAPWTFDFSVTCGDARVTDVARDYVAVLFLPLAPAGLSVYGTGRRLRMNQKQARNLLDNLKYVSGRGLARQQKLIPVVRSWAVAVFVTLVGAAAGAAAGWPLLRVYGLAFAPIGAAVANLIFVGATRPRRVPGHCTAGNSWPRR